MKTNYFLITMLLLLSMTSCSTYYRMTSRVERDGSMYREIYAQGDSAFIAGDKTHNPFPLILFYCSLLFSLYHITKSAARKIECTLSLLSFFLRPSLAFDPDIYLSSCIKMK